MCDRRRTERRPARLRGRRVRTVRRPRRGDRRADRSRHRARRRRGPDQRPGRGGGPHPTSSAFWQPHLRGRLRHALRADLRRLLGLRARTPSSRRAASRRPPTRDIAENAFYCPDDDLIAWDDVEPDPRPLRGVRRLHHRHRVRPRVRARHPDPRRTTRGATVVLELQADCFAGAWARDVEEGNSEFFELTARRPRQGAWPASSSCATASAPPPPIPPPTARASTASAPSSTATSRASSTAPATPTPLASGDLVVVEVPFTDAGGLRAGRQPPARRARPVARSRTSRTSGRCCSRRRASSGPRSPASCPIDPDADEVDCGGETYSGDVLVNASFYCVDDDTIYIDDVEPRSPPSTRSATTPSPPRSPASTPSPPRCGWGSTRAPSATNLHADCLTGVYASSGFLGNRQDQGQALFLPPATSTRP